MREIFEQYAAFWKKLGPNQKASIFAVTIVAILAFGGIVFYAQKPSFALLVGDLGNEDSAAVVGYLADNNHQYKQEGSNIYVEQDKVPYIRSQIVEKQLLKGGDEGYTLLDKTNLGLTDKIQDINIVRAVEGEIAKTLKNMTFVKAAKVKVSQGEKSLYAKSESPTKASVLLTLKPGTNPTPGQINSIVIFVAGAVPGLKANNIMVTDQNGKLLHSPREQTEEASNSILASDRLAFQMVAESALTTKAQSLLDAAYGAGKTRVSVNVTVKDPPPVREERKTELKGALKTDKKTERESKNATTGASAGGTASTKESTEAPGTSGVSSNETTTEFTKEYFPPSEVIIREPRIGFSIQKLSVALMIDKSVTMVQPPTPAGATTPPAPVEDPNIKTAIEQQVALAIGLDEKRNGATGDDKIVASVVEGMFKIEAPAEPPEGMFGTQTILELARYGAEAIVAIFLLLFLKGMIKKAGKGGAGAAGAEAAGLPPEVLARINARRSTEALIASDGQGASRVARKWMAGAKK